MKTEALVEIFLRQFDDSDFPLEFLQEYEIIECLAANTFRETYLVRNRQSAQLFVAKCHRRDMETFRNEFDLLKQLNHTAIPVIVGEYQNESMYCVVRSYIKGFPLSQWVEEHPLDESQVIALMGQLCDILAYLHGQTPPVIHRDIKPDNIIIDDAHTVYLIDFHIARRYRIESSKDTVHLGTKQYAAPEQYGFTQTDARSDIYSLGILLHWLSTGQENLNPEDDSMRKSRLGKIILKCTAFDPRSRYQKVEQVKKALSAPAFKPKYRIILLIILLCILGYAGWQNRAVLLPGQAQAIHFEEPLIEEAVRLMLDKQEEDPLSAEELATIQELFIFGDHIATDDASFHSIVDHFAHNDGVILRGTIHSLTDLEMLPNLRRISIAYQNITDVTPLAGLHSLAFLNLQHNPIQDIEPLSELSGLTDLILFDTLVTDLSQLDHNHQLNVLDVGYTPIHSMQAFRGMQSVKTLVIRKGSLDSIEQIADYLPGLEHLYLSETPVHDLTPLLQLSHLQSVEVSQPMLADAKAIADQGNFIVSTP